MNILRDSLNFYFSECSQTLFIADSVLCVNVRNGETYMQAILYPAPSKLFFMQLKIKIILAILRTYYVWFLVHHYYFHVCHLAADGKYGVHFLQIILRAFIFYLVGLWIRRPEYFIKKFFFSLCHILTFHIIPWTKTYILCVCALFWSKQCCIASPSSAVRGSGLYYRSLRMQSLHYLHCKSTQDYNTLKEYVLFLWNDWMNSLAKKKLGKNVV